MLHIVGNDNRDREHRVLRSMFEARKRVFVDLLKWDLPVLAGKYELDQFDDGHATYLVVADPQDNHLASARLLPTVRPALLDSLYPDLVEGEIPQGRHVFEITRFCLSRGAGARLRREARDTLLVGLAEYALGNGITEYTGVAELSWFEQITTFGWDCIGLGNPREHDGRLLTALHIRVDDTTVGKLAAKGIVSDTTIGLQPARAA
jgi:acyl-homoserine lactone synthase